VGRLVAWSPGGTRKHFLARLKATGQQMPVSDEWLESQMKREWTAHPFGLPKAYPSMHCFPAFLERGGGGQVGGGGGLDGGNPLPRIAAPPRPLNLPREVVNPWTSSLGDEIPRGPVWPMLSFPEVAWGSV